MSGHHLLLPNECCEREPHEVRCGLNEARLMGQGVKRFRRLPGPPKTFNALTLWGGGPAKADRACALTGIILSRTEPPLSRSTHGQIPEFAAAAGRRLRR